VPARGSVPVRAAALREEHAEASVREGERAPELRPAPPAAESVERAPVALQPGAPERAWWPPVACRWSKTVGPAQATRPGQAREPMSQTG
jgi:hypothetical protein